MPDLTVACLLRDSIAAHDDDHARDLRDKARRHGATTAQCAAALAERDRYLAETVTRLWTGVGA